MTEFKAQLIHTFKALKYGKSGKVLIRSCTSPICLLVPFVQDDISDANKIAILSKWRLDNIHGFPSIFNITDKGTRKWAQTELINREDRILFFVTDEKGEPLGHVGLSSFDYANETCEIDNIVRGEKDGPKGIMQQAVNVMLDWSYETLKPKKIHLRTFNDNPRALALYYRLKFKPVELIPLTRTEAPGVIEWKKSNENDIIDRFYIVMCHKNNTYKLRR